MIDFIDRQMAGGTTLDVSGVVVSGCSIRLFLRSALPVGKPEGTLVPGQPDAFVDSPHRGRRAAWGPVLLVRLLPQQHSDLQGVEFPPDGLRAHRVPQLPERVPQVKQAAEGHVADRDVLANPFSAIRSLARQPPKKLRELRCALVPEPLKRLIIKLLSAVVASSTANSADLQRHGDFVHPQFAAEPAVRRTSSGQIS